MSSNERLYKLLCELEIYELGNKEMFNNYLCNTIWCDTHRKSKKDIKQIVNALKEENAQKQLTLILDLLIEYDEEQTGMFDEILLENSYQANVFTE